RRDDEDLPAIPAAARLRERLVRPPRVLRREAAGARRRVARGDLAQALQGLAAEGLDERGLHRADGRDRLRPRRLPGREELVACEGDVSEEFGDLAHGFVSFSRTFARISLARPSNSSRVSQRSNVFRDTFTSFAAATVSPLCRRSSSASVFFASSGSRETMAPSWVITRASYAAHRNTASASATCSVAGSERHTSAASHPGGSSRRATRDWRRRARSRPAAARSPAPSGSVATTTRGKVASFISVRTSIAPPSDSSR